jgi:4-hydroxybenzoate polyprenyltransferase
MGWRTYLTLGRVSNLPTVWTNVVAGIVIAGALPAARSLFPLVLSLSLFYVGGMYLNDAFDRESDARQRPDRPIPSGAIPAAAVFAIGFGLLGAGLATLVAAAGPDARGPAAAAGLALASVIVTYDAWHKGNPIGPVLMGVARALVYVAAGVASAAALPPALVGGALVLLAYVIGLTYVAKQETLGRVRNLWPLLFLAVPFVYSAPLLLKPSAGTILYLALLACVGYALRQLTGPDRRIPAAVVTLIAGISLLDGTLIALHGEPALAWVGVAGFVTTLSLQRLVPGT